MAKRLVGDADAGSGVRQKRGGRHAGDGVGLENPRCAGRVDDHVGTGDARAAQRGVGEHGDALTGLGRLGRDARGDDVLRAALGVLGLEVVELVLGHDLDHGECDGVVVSKDCDGYLDSLDEPLDQHMGVKVKCTFDRLGQLAGCVDDGHAKGRPFGRGLDHALLPHRSDQLARVPRRLM